MPSESLPLARPVAIRLHSHLRGDGMSRSERIRRSEATTSSPPSDAGSKRPRRTVREWRKDVRSVTNEVWLALGLGVILIGTAVALIIDQTRSDQVEAVEQQSLERDYDNDHAAWKTSGVAFELCLTDKRARVESRANFRASESDRADDDRADTLAIANTVLTIAPDSTAAKEFATQIIAEKEARLLLRAETLDERYPALELGDELAKCEGQRPGPEPQLADYLG